ncbi:sugar porter family MFS transporter [Corynebacterium pygosceleis]|uniref:Sugar porter family MFS transporter n=1 Tax=Corynebacterium pygosceleis TaxID=2800406 RepID=A0ABT3WRV8_9CORY|nr:sugar porter family MFS transporter [Corynebacterium pygosceleis]MCK7674728.1 sugar porter family MFS transporter [Corynebacterium pygosceleis]MCL0119683.1 sugar porter family MFS transporter [Corynebacterium pygosceleis]MCX7444930.1 sugar porter family MFS transporter [Corynebacterium pygosceleis]
MATAQAIDVRAAQRRATRIALIASLGAFFFGFEGMVLNGAIRAVGTTFELGALAKGVAGSAGIIGGLFGAIIAGRISDRIGRRTVLNMVGPFLLFEAIFGAFSPWLGGYLFLVLCRVIGGIGFGAATTVGPGYIAEIAPPRIRGRLIAFRQLEIILGLFLAGIINLFVLEKVGSSTDVVGLGLMAWQWMFLCLIIPAVFFIVMTATIPESPRYLVAKGRYDEAKKVLATVSADPDLDVRIDRIRKTLNAETTTMSISAILRSKWRGLVAVGVALAAFQQLTGINGVFFYSNSLFEAVGFDESKAFQQTLLITAFKIVGVVFGITFVDRIGRRNLLIGGGALITVSLATVATVFTIAPVVDGQPDISHSKLLGYVAVGALCCFILGFTSSWGPIFSIVMGEMFPNQIRGGAMSLASGADFLVNFIVVLLFPFAIAWSPSATYWIYAMFGVMSVIFTVKYLKETTGKDLEEMDELA